MEVPGKEWRWGEKIGGGGNPGLNVYKMQLAEFLRGDFSQSTQMFPLSVSVVVPKTVSVFNLELK